MLRTIGDHLRKRRLDLGLLQREVAEQLGADPASVTNWELNRTKPALHFLPGIVRFVGYAPWTTDRSIGERLLAYRRDRGITQEVMARRLGVDPGTLSRWERILRVPTGKYTDLAKTFLGQFAARVPRDRDPSTGPLLDGATRRGASYRTRSGA